MGINTVYNKGLVIVWRKAMGNHDIPCRICGKDMRGLTGCRGEESHTIDDYIAAKKLYERQGKKFPRQLQDRLTEMAFKEIRANGN